MVSIPTISRLVSRAKADVAAVRTSGAAWLRKTVEQGLATVWAGLTYGLYGKFEGIARDIIPGPENSEGALLRHAYLWLGDDNGRKAARAAQLTITGTGTSGTTMPVGTRFRRSDGALYETQSAFTFDVDDIVVESIALESEPGYGADGNAVVGDALTMVSEVVGLDADWLVEGTPGATVGDGTDIEELVDLADRILAVGSSPPAGGKLADYETWAREVSGVGQAYAVAGIAGSGTITVFFVTEDPDDPIPGAPLVESVQDHLDEEVPAQVGVVQAIAPTALELGPRVSLKPNTADTRAAATLAMKEILALRAVPGQPDNNGIFDRSWITEALSSAVGETGHTLTTPSDDIEVESYELLVLGLPVYVTKE